MRKIIVIQNHENRYAHQGYGGSYFKNGIHDCHQFKTLKEARQFAKEKNLIGRAISIPFVDYVKQAIVDYCAFSCGDRYGQMGITSTHSIWGKAADDVKDWNKTERLFSIILYGYTYGTYDGVCLTSGILDDQLNQLCRSAYHKSVRYKNAMSQ